MVRSNARRVGSDAEDRAFSYLKKHGLRLVKRNFETRRGEIDLIMLDGACLTFVEVRYRSESSFGGARFSVDRRKQRKLIDSAAMFLSMHDLYRSHVCRFDIVAVDRDHSGRLSIEWLKDAFRPTD